MNQLARTRVKICGIRTPEALLAAAEAGADAVGFVFVPKTPRYIEPERAFELSRLLPPFLSAVGVVRDLTIDKFADVEEACPLPLMQLHGAEPEGTVRQCGPGVIKAVPFSDRLANELKRWDAVDEVDAILIDGPRAGSGEPLDWPAVAEAIRGIETPIMLAGGLTPDNVTEAVRTVQPYAVDVSSGVEKPNKPGEKDPVRIKAFCQAAAATLAG